MNQVGKVTDRGVLTEKTLETGKKEGLIFEHADLNIQKRYITTLECFVEFLDKEIEVMKNIGKMLKRPDSDGGENNEEV